MTTVTTTRRSTILTDRACQKCVTERIKVYDRKCRGLYVSIIPAGVAILGAAVLAATPTPRELSR